MYNIDFYYNLIDNFECCFDIHSTTIDMPTQYKLIKENVKAVCVDMNIPYHSELVEIAIADYVVDKYFNAVI